MSSAERTFTMTLSESCKLVADVAGEDHKDQVKLMQAILTEKIKEQKVVMQDLHQQLKSARDWGNKLLDSVNQRNQLNRDLNDDNQYLRKRLMEARKEKAYHKKRYKTLRR